MLLEYLQRKILMGPFNRKRILNNKPLLCGSFTFSRSLLLLLSMTSPNVLSLTKIFVGPWCGPFIMGHKFSQN